MSSPSRVLLKRVLIIEPDVDLRAAVSNRLRAEGYEVMLPESSASLRDVDVTADFAVVRRRGGDGVALEPPIGASDARSTLTFGWFPNVGAGLQGGVREVEEAREHVTRIFSAVADVFLTLDRAAARSVADCLRVLAATISASSLTTASTDDVSGEPKARGYS